MMYQHPEHEASIAAERYRFIRESFLNTPRMQRPRLLQHSAYILGLSFLRLGRGLLRYGTKRPATAVGMRRLEV